jgi:alpha-beta hydrolase superfamily lysophospholipase
VKVRKRKLVLILVGVAAACYVVSGCMLKMMGTGEMDERIAKIRKRMVGLAECEPGEYSKEIEDYFEYYGLGVESEIAGVEHFFGTFESGDYTLAGHIYRPGEYTATVVVLHGYMNHCGQLKHLIRDLLGRSYAVAIYDMPGHGLSSGKRGAIEEYSQYRQTVADFMKVAGGKTDGPYYLIGFSNGGGVAIDYLLQGKESEFEKVVLVAPLVRNVVWGWSKVGYWLYRPFGAAVPRKFRRNSSDKEFLEFSWHKDWLHCRRVPMEWVGAVQRWNEKIAKAETSDKAVKVIQGSKDTTVSWKYNLDFVKDKFSNVEVSMIEAGRHELFNESASIRDKVFEEIADYLQK